MTLLIKVLGKKNKKTILLVASSHFVNQNIGIVITISSIFENVENYTAKDETKTTMVLVLQIPRTTVLPYLHEINTAA